MTAAIAVATYLVLVLGIVYFNYAASVVSGNRSSDESTDN